MKIIPPSRDSFKVTKIKKILDPWPSVVMSNIDTKFREAVFEISNAIFLKFWHFVKPKTHPRNFVSIFP